jgi:N-acetylglucosamine-6-phosphate deacetylase
MPGICIANGQVYIDHHFVNREIHIQDGKINLIDSPLENCTVFDASGLKVVPGFIDTHSHGANGFDVNRATAEELEKISCFMASKGTPSWLCSILTDTQKQTDWCIEQFNNHKAMEQNGAELIGIHLEGPFLSKRYKGSMPENLLMDNDVSLLRHYQDIADGNIRYITISPELEGASDVISTALALEIVVGIGRSDATYDEAMESIKMGATVGTHVGNASRLFHQHEPSILVP